MGRTLAEKVWDAHVVRRHAGEPDLLYVDLHLLHELNTPVAFDRPRASGRTVRRPDLTLGTEDHNTPVLAGRKVADGVEVVLVPGSATVRRQAVAEGLDRVFADAGVVLRHAGCSMCAAVNEDRLRAGRRAASTNNRNFEGRQGKGSRTHIVSPAVAAASAVAGRLAAPGDLDA